MLSFFQIFSAGKWRQNLRLNDGVIISRNPPFLRQN
jgi:hypothetical protein